jgi:hypothetical protein
VIAAKTGAAVAVTVGARKPAAPAAPVASLKTAVRAPAAPAAPAALPDAAPVMAGGWLIVSQADARLRWTGTAQSAGDALTKFAKANGIVISGDNLLCDHELLIVSL